METEQVWQAIAQARAAVMDEDEDSVDDGEAVAARLVTVLEQWEPSAVAEFDRSLRELLAASYRNDLWAAAYLINGGASDDGFDYFRGWLVTQGRAVFERALADPDSLAALPAVAEAVLEGEELESEDVLVAARGAYERMTGTGIPPGAPVTVPELGPAGWDFDFDEEQEMRRHLPRLAALSYDAED